MTTWPHTDEDDLRYHDVDECEWPEVPKVAEVPNEPRTYRAFYYLQTAPRAPKE